MKESCGGVEGWYQVVGSAFLKRAQDRLLVKGLQDSKTVAFKSFLLLLLFFFKYCDIDINILSWGQVSKERSLLIDVFLCQVY